MAADSFTYADGALATVSSGKWVNLTGSVPVVSGTVQRGLTGGADNLVYYNVATGSNDHWVEATVSSFNGVGIYNNIGVAARVSTASGGSGYFAVRSTDPAFSLDLYSFVNGVFASRIGSYSGLAVTAAAGVLRLTCTGSTISVQWNAATVISVTNTAVTAGQLTGIAAYWQDSGNTGTAATLDNWQNSVRAGVVAAVGPGGTATVAGTFAVGFNGAVAAVGPGGTGPVVGTFTPTTTDRNGVLAAVGPAATSVIVGTFHGIYTGALTATGPTGASSMVGTSVAPSLPLVTISGRKLMRGPTPFQIGSMSSWDMAHNGSNADITTAIDAIADAGFTVILVSPCGTNYNSYGGAGWVRYQNGAGQNFFAGANFALPLGPAWASMDWVISEANRRSLVVGLSLYTGFNNDQGIGADLVAAGTTAAYNYGNAVATRYATATNIIWHYGADYSFDWPAVPAQVVDAWFHGVFDAEAAAGIGHRIQIAEPMQPRTSHTQFRAQQGNGTTGYGWLRIGVNSLYEYNTSDVEQYDAVYNQAGATDMPVWDCEIYYRGATWDSANTPSPPSTQELRERVYSAPIRGYSGVGYGDADFFSFGKTALGAGGPSAFLPVLSRSETIEAGRGFTVMRQYTADVTWAPSSTFVTTGLGSGDTKAAVGASSTKALAYFPSSRTVVVDTSILPGTDNVRLRWFDPTTGNYTTVATSEAQSASRSVTYPSGNHTDGFTDWLFVAELIPGNIGVAAAVGPGGVAVVAGTFVTGAPPVNGVLAGIGPVAAVTIVGTFAAGVIRAGILTATGPTGTATIVGATLARTQVRLGALTVIAAYLGTTPVLKMYVGPTQIWQ